MPSYNQTYKNTGRHIDKSQGLFSQAPGYIKAAPSFDRPSATSSSYLSSCLPIRGLHPHKRDTSSSSKPLPGRRRSTSLHTHTHQNVSNSHNITHKNYNFTQTPPFHPPPHHHPHLRPLLLLLPPPRPSTHASSSFRPSSFFRLRFRYQWEVMAV